VEIEQNNYHLTIRQPTSHY